VLLALERIGYRIAYRLLQVYWFLARPHVLGVKCLLTDGDSVLLVRHTYGDRRWDLPGGTLKRGEEPVAGARREIAEELGLTIDDWDALGELSACVGHRHDELYCFRAELRAPDLTLQKRELATARWFPRAEVPAKVARYVGPIMARAWPA
jgi:8-oxo-dGTP pyrophosphatase MutT (NUDIX family)